MTSVGIRRSKISGTVRCPSSKSYTHRAIAVASLCRGESQITNALLSRDTLATIAGCRALGAEITHDESKVRIRGKDEFAAPENVVNAENSGTTIRILASMATLVKEGYTVLTGDESLRKRPMQPILDTLNHLGVPAFATKGDGKPPLVIRGGGLEGGNAEIDGSISSQFISGLLITGVHSHSGIDLRVKGDLVSKPYVTATIATMKHFGISVSHDTKYSHFNILPGDYISSSFDVPSDFSTAALIISAGVLVGNKLVLKGLNFNLPQGDSSIIEIVTAMGGMISANTAMGTVTVSGSDKLHGGNFDLRDTPDLLPVVAILALRCDSPVTIKGVTHARLKETDRVANIASELRKLGARIEEFPDGLTISAPKRLRNASLEAYNDHRLFMAFTIAAMMTEKSIVAGAESVDVSYPSFVTEMKRLGARVSHISDRE